MAQSNLHHMCTVIHWLQTVHVSKHHHPTALCHYPWQDWPWIGWETDRSLIFLPRHHQGTTIVVLRSLLKVASGTLGNAELVDSLGEQQYFISAVLKILAITLMPECCFRV